VLDLNGIGADQVRCGQESTNSPANVRVVEEDGEVVRRAGTVLPDQGGNVGLAHNIVRSAA
jgi:hypothetical protein